MLNPQRKTYFFLSLFFCLFNSIIFSSYAQEDSLSATINTGLKDEVMIHPYESFTAYTYKKGEVFYAQSLVLAPGFAQIGITDWLTAELPFWEWFGSVASINLRFKLTEQKKWKPALAYENQYQYLPKEIDLLEENTINNLHVYRKGHNWFHRINASWKATENFYVHFSFGGTYAEFLQFDNADSTNFYSKNYKEKITPDISLGLDWRWKPWISIGGSISYGSTYMYIDNVARKKQFTIGTRFAPFVNNHLGILNKLRIELVYFNMQFGNIPVSLQSPMGFIYWQWQLFNKTNK